MADPPPPNELKTGENWVVKSPKPNLEYGELVLSWAYIILLNSFTSIYIYNII